MGKTFEERELKLTPDRERDKPNVGMRSPPMDTADEPLETTEHVERSERASAGKARKRHPEERS